MRKLPARRVLVLVLTAVLLLTLCACSKTPEQPGVQPEGQTVEQNGNPGVQGGNFAEHDDLAAALTTQGNTIVTLTRNETADLTGIELDGRKEIILNNFTLTLKGQYGITEKAVLDIKPGEGFTEGVIDMSALQFDLPNAPVEVPSELALIEIRPGIAIGEPQYKDGIRMHEFPGILAVIEYVPAQ